MAEEGVLKKSKWYLTEGDYQLRDGVYLGRMSKKQDRIDKGKHYYFLKNILKEIQEKHSKKLIEFNEPLKIVSCKFGGKEVVEYHPDFTLRFKTGVKSHELIIFEFIDKQSDIKTMADISRIAFIDNCRKAIFLSNEEKKQNETSRIVETFTSNLNKLSRSYHTTVMKKNLLDITVLHAPLGYNKENLKQNIIKEINRVKKLLKQ